MTINLETVYLVITVAAVMIFLGIFTVKKLMNTRSKFTAFLMVIEEIIIGITAIMTFVLAYQAMDDYESFVIKYGKIKDIYTYISIYFCASQVVILFLVSIYRAINKRRKFIKNRRIIK